MRTKAFLLCAALALAAAATATSSAQQQLSKTDDWCRLESPCEGGESICDVREYSLPATGAPLTVDARPNGGVRVEGEARTDVRVCARIAARAQDEARAKQILGSVQVHVAGDSVSATGPDRLGDGEGWWVSYRLAVPQQSSLTLKSRNGGLGVSHVDGRLDLTTVNGGIKLSAVSGDVRGRTSNGGIDVDLDGPAWQGEGLDVETHNGGLKLSVPENYSAHLQTATVNGGVKVDFPVSTDARRDRNIDTQLGAGGALIRLRTTNGGIKIMKK